MILNGKEVLFEKFPNNETRLIHTELDLSEISNCVHFKYEDDSDLIKLMLLKNYIDESGAYSSLFIYYMPYSRMDRSENYSPFTLRYVANFINSLSFDGVFVVEPHSNVTPALLNNVRSWYINEDLVEEVIKIANLDMTVDYIMYPDAGAASRYKNLKYSNVIIGNKTRDFVTGEIKGLQLIGDIKEGSKKVLILDDLSSYGGTFIHSSKALKEQGFEEVYLLVAHAENSIFKGELFNHISKVFTTDSILTEQNNWENKKYEKQLHIFSLEDYINNKIEKEDF